MSAIKLILTYIGSFLFYLQNADFYAVCHLSVKRFQYVSHIPS